MYSIRSLRNRIGLSQQELADLVGISTRELSLAEQERLILDRSEKQQIAAALGVKINNLIWACDLEETEDADEMEEFEAEYEDIEEDDLEE
jgi:transcriptional regulator with XRE-family HTH domain